MAAFAGLDSAKDEPVLMPSQHVQQSASPTRVADEAYPVLHMEMGSILKLKFRARSVYPPDPLPTQDDAFVYLTADIILWTAPKSVIPRRSIPADGQVDAGHYCLRTTPSAWRRDPRSKSPRPPAVPRLQTSSKVHYGYNSFSMALFRNYFVNNNVLTPLVLEISLQVGLDLAKAPFPINAWFPKHPQKHSIQAGIVKAGRASSRRMNTERDRSTSSLYRNRSSSSDPEKLTYFISTYREYKDSFQMNQDKMNKFKKHLREFRDDTLQRADVVVCTAFATSSTAIRDDFNPSVIWVDEAARFKESELWLILA
ncbi:hypothetical protein BDV06DRAFT_225367 [Aspergillus oleicola]